MPQALHITGRGFPGVSSTGMPRCFQHQHVSEQLCTICQLIDLKTGDQVLIFYNSLTLRQVPASTPNRSSTLSLTNNDTQTLPEICFSTPCLITLAHSPIIVPLSYCKQYPRSGNLMVAPSYSPNVVNRSYQFGRQPTSRCVGVSRCEIMATPLNGTIQYRNASCKCSGSRRYLGSSDNL